MASVQLTSRQIISRIADYLKRTNFPENGSLSEKAVFIVDGARVFDDAPVSQPNSYVPQIGIVHGRYVDVIAWAVQQNGFYNGEECGEIKREDLKIIHLPVNHSLDSLI